MLYLMIRRVAMLAAVLSALVALLAFVLFRASLPSLDGTYPLQGLSAPAQAEFDGYGIPRISARTREDAFRVLGYVTARDRLFQMDLMRRRMAGRLAEVLGPALAESDRWHRTMGFERVADAVWARLPADQRSVLKAYAEGVNKAVAGMRALPFEFLALGYRPAPWWPLDSLLVVLGMHETLGWTGGLERMATVMEAALPPSVFAFFTPPLDRYTDRVLNGPVSGRPDPSIPANELKALLAAPGRPESLTGLVNAAAAHRGSNGWVVGPARTRDGRAMLANDMHLELRVPNLWYRAELRYGAAHLAGFTLPGVPLLVSGSNGRVAWGFTNVQGDFVDLVALDIDPGNPSRYRTPQGYVRFGERPEIVRVKGGPAQLVRVRTTLWGPVLPEPLLGRPVAVRWTALDPEATDLEFLNLDRSGDVHEALDLFNRSGGPPLNALAADSSGNIGWTLAGRIPRRFGLNGLVSRSWADGTRGWDGYIPPGELPRSVNPASGFIVNANQRMVDGGYPHPIGHYYDSGHRAFRIAERLSQTRGGNEREMLALQLDTGAGFYRFYQKLALDVLGAGEDAGLRRDLERWDGLAERESAGLAVLVEFRRLLLDAVVSPYMAKCRGLDPEFRFLWPLIDEPLQQLLEARLPELLPDRARHGDWSGFLRALLRRAEDNVRKREPADSPAEPTWGRANLARIAHPFSAVFPRLQRWLDMPPEPLPGCPHCVRLHEHEPDGGASERLVVAPGREGDGILHMPGGQSGHPLSPHYRDQQRAWVDGAATPLLAGHPRHRLMFEPEGGRVRE